MRSLFTCLTVLSAMTIARGADAPLASRITPSRETTFFNGPLDKDGEVDFETALNERLRGKITPEQNANVLLIHAMGPNPEGKGRLPDKYFQWLGIAPLPEEGNYFVILPRFVPADDRLQVRFHQRFDLVDHAGRAPWKSADFPYVAAWLKANEKPLELVHAAARREHYYNPLVLEGPNAALATVPVPNVQNYRYLARALAARAMLRMGEGLPEEAWNDLVAGYRLARFAAQGGIAVEYLIGLAIEGILATPTQAYLENCRLSSRQLRARLQDLQKLPPFAEVPDKLDLAERVLVLDIFKQIRHSRLAILEGSLSGKSIPLTAEQKKALASLDWTDVQQSSNRWTDRAVDALRTRDLVQRKRALEKLSNEIIALKGPASAYLTANNFLFDETPGRSRSQVISDRSLHVFNNLHVVASSLQYARDRTQQRTSNLSTGFALAVYRRDHRHFPENLSDLVPDYLPALPLDLFTGKPLLYVRKGEGFVLYSVGHNEKDDGGRSFDEGGDDLTFRIVRLAGPDR